MPPLAQPCPKKTPATMLIRNVIAKETQKQLLKGRPYQLDAAIAIATGRNTVLVAPTGSGFTG